MRPLPVVALLSTCLVQPRMAHPNRESLTFDGATFKLILDDWRIGRGMTAESSTLERSRRSSRLEVQSSGSLEPGQAGSDTGITEVDS